MTDTYRNSLGQPLGDTTSKETPTHTHSLISTSTLTQRHTHTPRSWKNHVSHLQPACQEATAQHLLVWVSFLKTDRVQGQLGWRGSHHRTADVPRICASQDATDHPPVCSPPPAPHALEKRLLGPPPPALLWMTETQPEEGAPLHLPQVHEGSCSVALTQGRNTAPLVPNTHHMLGRARWLSSQDAYVSLCGDQGWGRPRW